MTNIDIDITDIWINMPTTTERAVCVNSYEIYQWRVAFLVDTASFSCDNLCTRGHRKNLENVQFT